MVHAGLCDRAAFEGPALSSYKSYARLPRDRMIIPRSDDAHAIAADLRAFIAGPAYPCVGAKAALSRGQISAVVLDDMRCTSGDLRLHTALMGFVARARRKPALFQSFAAIFETPNNFGEAGFENALWERIQAVHALDHKLGHPWDRRVSQDPNDPHFSLSFAGEAFFVVGMHPNASRPARRFRTPVLIFNMHAQFEQLRAQGRYEGLRETIAKRDRAFAGSTNPMLQRHGKMSEARQYSGRVVNDDWRCPFLTST